MFCQSTFSQFLFQTTNEKAGSGARSFWLSMSLPSPFNPTHPLWDLYRRYGDRERDERWDEDLNVQKKNHQTEGEERKAELKDLESVDHSLHYRWEIIRHMIHELILRSRLMTNETEMSEYSFFFSLLLLSSLFFSCFFRRSFVFPSFLTTVTLHWCHLAKFKAKTTVDAW